MLDFKIIDSEVTKLQIAVREYAETLKFNIDCEFKLAEEISEIPWAELNYKGIYLIEIKNNQRFETINLWIENFKEEWENSLYKLRFVPNLKKKRIAYHKELTDWIPIYIGKSKNVGGRVKEHIFKKLGKNTFALKLMERTNLKNETFRLSTIKLEVENYDWIVPVIENSLRNRINPIIGRQ